MPNKEKRKKKRTGGYRTFILDNSRFTIDSPVINCNGSVQEEASDHVDESLAENCQEPDAVARIQQYGALTNNIMLKAIYNTSDVLSTTYQFPLENGGNSRVKELTVESSLSFRVPILFLKICIEEERKQMADFESLGKLGGNWEVMRQRRISQHKKYMEKYQIRHQYLQQRCGAPFFKRSVDKMIGDLEFVPTNLHLQRMCVESPAKSQSLTELKSSPQHSGPSPTYTPSSKNWVTHDVITVGAAANHQMGFKQGGLLNLLNVTKSKKSILLESIEQCLQRGRSVSELDKLLILAVELRDQIKTQIEKLRLLIKVSSTDSPSHLSHTTDSINASSEALAILSQKVCEIVTCYDNQHIIEAIASLAIARPYHKPLYCESSTSISPESPDFRDHEDSVSLNSVFFPTVESSETEWEMQSLSLKTLLARVVKSAHPILHPDQEEVFLRGKVADDEQFGQAEANLINLQGHVEKLTNDVLTASTFVDLRDQPSYVDAELIYRRNTIFSQTLSACICGVTTLIASFIHDDLVLHQFSEVGIFLQVESLISTYGSELGMMQDYAVGVYDLANVSFKCVKSSTSLNLKTGLSKGQNINEKYLPTVQRDDDDVTVFMHFDEFSFALLPSELRDGKLIKIFPAFYNVGINEEQTLAERFGNTSLQASLNMEAKKRTLEYYDMIRDRCPSSIAERLRNANSFLRQISVNASPRKKSPVINDSGDAQRPLMDLMNSLSDAVKGKKHKNVEVLRLAGDICRRLNGVRISSCKSAKDRTSMSVTLEQARILVNEHGVAQDKFTDVLNCMRSEGTRRDISLKNTGSRKYAFTSVQLMTFPKLYRAPDGTYGKGET